MGILDSLAAVVREADLQVLRALYSRGHGSLRWGIWGLTWIGSGWSTLVLIPLASRPKTREFALTLMGGIVTQGVVVWAIKAAIGRLRPWIAFGWPAPLWSPEDGSFPSGHSAGCFCVAAFLISWPRYGREQCGAARPPMAIVALGVATLVAVSRVMAGAHYPSDVVGGALLGSLVGIVAARSRAF